MPLDNRVSPILALFLRKWNENAEGEFRQKLARHFRNLDGTADDGQDEVRGRMVLDWLVYIYAGMWRGCPGLMDADWKTLQSAVIKVGGIEAVGLREGDWPALTAVAWNAAWDALLLA